METKRLKDVIIKPFAIYDDIYAILDSCDNLIFVSRNYIQIQQECRKLNTEEKYYFWKPFRIVKLSN